MFVRAFKAVTLYIHVNKTKQAQHTYEEATDNDADKRGKRGMRNVKKRRDRKKQERKKEEKFHNRFSVRLA